ncbi:cleft lip and palate transmembrane protein 1-like protein [Lasius niger]|uniref:Lipid scramblase CLPTM1L n=1 Tax=Lasius niger TaxID=67767 RepID=A0A0J7NI16_LASNI|nr:cleft lip and palate transmembrane protein 1-like protein [Lasius niger]
MTQYMVPEAEAFKLLGKKNSSFQKANEIAVRLATMENLKNLGFSDKDVDEVKGIFADTNIYLLGGTFFIAAIHLLFDFLAIKNDVSFWRKKSNLIGLSKWTVMWRAFSQTVIFFYLCDEGSSLLILIPTGISTVIELWKLKKISRVQLISSNSILPRIQFKTDDIDAAEVKTREFDAEIGILGA